MMTPTYSRRSSGFSLVEVTISIGIIAFSVIALMGLMGTSLTSERESAADTTLTDLIRTVASDLRSRPFSPVTDTHSLDYLYSQSTTSYTRYFGLDGAALLGASDATYYTCTVKLTPQTQFNTVASPIVNLYEAEVLFTWPHPATAFQKTFHFNLARHAD